jgi:hypothetical protein
MLYGSSVKKQAFPEINKGKMLYFCLKPSLCKETLAKLLL